MTSEANTGAFHTKIKFGSRETEKVCRETTLAGNGRWMLSEIGSVPAGLYGCCLVRSRRFCRRAMNYLLFFNMNGAASACKARPSKITAAPDHSSRQLISIWSVITTYVSSLRDAAACHRLVRELDGQRLTFSEETLDDIGLPRISEDEQLMLRTRQIDIRDAIWLGKPSRPRLNMRPVLWPVLDAGRTSFAPLASSHGDGGFQT